MILHSLQGYVFKSLFSFPIKYFFIIDDFTADRSFSHFEETKLQNELHPSGSKKSAKNFSLDALL